MLFKKAYPRTYRALQLLSIDNGMSINPAMVDDDRFTVPEEWNRQLPTIEKKMLALSDDDLETLVMGEDGAMLKIIPSCYTANLFLEDAFEGDLSQVFYPHLSSR